MVSSFLYCLVNLSISIHPPRKISLMRRIRSGSHFGFCLDLVRFLLSNALKMNTVWTDLSFNSWSFRKYTQKLGVDPPYFKQYRYAKLHRFGVVLLELAGISWDDSLKRYGLENALSVPSLSHLTFIGCRKATDHYRTIPTLQREKKQHGVPPPCC
jgi:hypothetical protein